MEQSRSNKRDSNMMLDTTHYDEHYTVSKGFITGKKIKNLTHKKQKET